MKTEELDKFQEILENGLVKLCSQAGVLGGDIMISPDIEQKWNEYIVRYTEDAVKNFEQYPSVTYAWAAFLGMGVAWNWDNDWIVGKLLSYEAYYGPNGYDDLDENVLYTILGLEREGADAKLLNGTLQSCADATMALIRHEQIQLDTQYGFHILVRAWEVFFRLGAAIFLHKSGYKKVPLS